MKTLFVLLLLAVVCKGNHLKVRQLIDMLRAQEAEEYRRHEITAGKRHEVTAGVKRHELTSEAKRHEVTDAAKRHEFTAEAKRHGYTTAAKRHKFTAAAKRQGFTLNLPTSTPRAYTHDTVVDEFTGFQEAFLFPGSHYLIDMIRKHCESGMGLKMAIEDIKDNFEIPDCELKDLGKVFGLLQWVQDPDSVALLVTRMLIKPVLKERMKCPATILDMGFIKLLLAKKQEFVANDDEALYTFFKNMAPLVDPALEPLAGDVATMSVLEFHGSIFNETMEFLWKYGLKDLAYASHSIYHELQRYFRSIQDGNHFLANGMALKMRIESALSGVRCPSSSEVVEYHKTEMQRFKDVFALMETENICLKVTAFLSKYIHTAIPGYQPDFENNAPLDDVCAGIKLVIDGIVQEFSEYEYFLYSMDITEFKAMTGNVFTDTEWAVLEEALHRLDFARIP
ncbi:uncharacterized protein LOC123562928 [Mercenaria mercenaria]|uniref:uncharacterized protein LOC123562928 n=1 Tax=Mercenaria mercenaria TaxID=6596 RepID=UPI00234E4A2C|nr:uncharacterized protein LOC123562928 [Mercenaria mercenaria]